MKSALAILLLAAALALSGCSSFEREWRAASVTKPRDPFAGAWEGRWTSAKHRSATGFMGGRLRCVFTPLDATHYRAHFKANWLSFASSYQTTFTTERHGGELRFRGEQHLSPLFGGLYRYEGRATATRFTTSYDSSYDHGRFELTRPAPVP